MPDRPTTMMSIPAKLYKYRALSEQSRSYTLDLIAKNSLWFAAPSSFNDPFDCRLPVPTTYSPAAWKKIAAYLYPGALEGVDLDSWDPTTEPPKKLQQLLELIVMLDRSHGGQDPKNMTFAEVMSASAGNAIKRATREIDQAVGVLTLTQACDHIVLWANYADNHHGICLEFDTAATNFPRLCSVHYANDSPDYDDAAMVLSLHQANANNREGLLANIAYQAAINQLSPDKLYHWTGRWLYSKSADWSYEREWRSVEAQPGLYELPDAALTRVIVGCAASDAAVAAVREALTRRRTPVPLYRAKRKAGVYGLDIVPID